jgi:hypothetical protein
MEPAPSDYNNRLIPLTVIQFKDWHCSDISTQFFLKNKFNVVESKCKKSLTLQHFDEIKSSMAVWCQFHQHFHVQIFRTKVVSAAFTTNMQLEKAAKTTFVQKICTENVDEIDT